jgi:hypothetical protein
VDAVGNLQITRDRERAKAEQERRKNLEMKLWKPMTQISAVVPLDVVEREFYFLGSISKTIMSII